MNKYWMIGTKASSFINRFIKFIDQGMTTGNEFLIKKLDDNKTHLLISRGGVKLDEFSSSSTANQYLEAWAAFGFVIKAEGKYIVNTNLDSKEDLIKLSKIYVVKKSKDKQTQRYRNTILINVLFNASVINWIDISKKGIEQPKGDFKPESIVKLIGSYEEEIAKDKTFVKQMKEVYDKQF